MGIPASPTNEPIDIHVYHEPVDTNHSHVANEKRARKLAPKDVSLAMFQNKPKTAGSQRTGGKGGGPDG